MVNLMFNADYPEGPTDEAKIDSKEYGGVLIGENELGSVHLHSVFGNEDSNVKIAYLIGMHPLESKSHRALFETIFSQNHELRYSYCIYNIDVNIVDSETEGRMDGQLLAREFVAPHIIGNDYSFFCDVHSNKGLVGPGKYEKTNFLFAPGFDDLSVNYMDLLLEEIPELVYYAPEYRTSPDFITVPVAKEGIPTIVYETFSYEPMEKSYSLAKKLADAIDNLDFENK